MEYKVGWYQKGNTKRYIRTVADDSRSGMVIYQTKRCFGTGIYKCVHPDFDDWFPKAEYLGTALENELFSLQWKKGETSIDNLGIYRSIDQALVAINDWWQLNDFKPKYIRQWTNGNVTTIDYGLHESFYKITKVDKSNFPEVMFPLDKIKPN